MKIELSAERSTREPGYLITAYYDDLYAGEALFIGYPKREALRQARETVKNYGGLGNYDSRRG